MSFKAYDPIEANVTATVGEILAADLTPAISEDGIEVRAVLVRNTGSYPVDVFSGAMEDADCEFGQGWPLAVGGYMTFSIADKDLPNEGLKAMCGTGLTSTVVIVRN